jgi:peptidoglycan DL-endopeptidase CwlO
MRRRTYTAVFASCLMFASTVAATPASADKVSDLNAQVDRLIAQEEALREDSERLAEQQNAAQVEFDVLQREVGVVETKLLAQTSEISALNAKLAEFAISTYKFGDLTTGLATVIGVGGIDLGQREGYSSVIFGGAIDVTDQMKAVRQDTGKLERDLLAKQQKQQKLVATIGQKRDTIAKKAKQLAALEASTSVELAVAKVERQRAIEAADARAFAARTKALADKKAADTSRRNAAQPKPAAATPQPRTGPAANAPAAGGGPATTAKGKPAPTTKAPPKARPAPPPAPAVSGAAGRAVSAAYSQIGVPYAFATENPNVSFDCSGLTQWAWSQAGVSIPRVSSAQWNGLPHVSLDEIQPGDLIFYYSDVHHVAIYVGNGTVIHAPFTGSTVSLAPLRGNIIGAARPG